MFELDNDWGELLREEREQQYFRELEAFVEREYAAHTVYPRREDALNALRLTGYRAAKVVILGQDPYHGPGQAHGLSFSVRPGVPHPPSLRNIFKELRDDAGIEPPQDGCLQAWAERGVLLLNTVLTVRQGEANSHRNRGWERFTDAVIRKLDRREQPLVFMLWGAPAQKKAALLRSGRHRVIEAPHPSPLSAYRGFFGSRPFTTANRLLAESGQAPIDWRL